VTARHDGELVWLSLPAGHVEPAEPPAGLVDALGVAPVWFGRNEQELVVELASPAQVRDLRPDIAALGAYPVTRVVVTSWDGDEADIVSRVFAPSIGVPEDQVTGSAHATLGPLWALRSGRSRLTAYQASSRGGELDLVMRGERVEIGGRAVTTNRGDVLV
jgi:predicted PhzF superfamily epimerase YddE/YHI9